MSVQILRFGGFIAVIVDNEEDIYLRHLPIYLKK